MTMKKISLIATTLLFNCITASQLKNTYASDIQANKEKQFLDACIKGDVRTFDMLVHTELHPDTPVHW